MNYLETYAFYILAFLAIASALTVVSHRKPTYAVLSLAVTMIALSGLFILLQAYFVAVIQILIYAGAILVLFLFVIMLLGLDDTEPAKKPSGMQKIIPLALVATFLSELLVASLAWRNAGILTSRLQGTVEHIGEALFSQYLLPFELISVILLIGIFGVVNLAQRKNGN